MTPLTSQDWRRSSHSGSNGGQCVEVAEIAARRRAATRT